MSILVYVTRGPFIPFQHCLVERKRGRIQRMKYWEIIVNKIIRAGWNCGLIIVYPFCPDIADTTADGLGEILQRTVCAETV